MFILNLKNLHVLRLVIGMQSTALKNCSAQDSENFCMYKGVALGHLRFLTG